MNRSPWHTLALLASALAALGPGAALAARLQRSRENFSDRIKGLDIKLD
jgi:hypothetical protein